MSDLKRSNPNPREGNVNAVGYTALSVLYDRMQTIGMIGDGDVFAGGMEHLIGQGVLKTLDDFDQIREGDLVSYGNRKGVVTGVTLNAGRVVGLTIFESLSYLPLLERANPAAYGYDASGAGRVVTFNTDQVDGTGEYMVDGGTSERIATGSIVVYRVGESKIIDALEASGFTEKKTYTGTIVLLSNVDGTPVNFASARIKPSGAGAEENVVYATSGDPATDSASEVGVNNLDYDQEYVLDIDIAANTGVGTYSEDLSLEQNGSFDNALVIKAPKDGSDIVVYIFIA